MSRYYTALPAASLSARMPPQRRRAFHSSETGIYMTSILRKLAGSGRSIWVRRAVPLALAGLVAACASIIGPRQIDLPQERMQQSLDRRFPMHQRALGVFEVELSHPKLDIL